MPREELIGSLEQEAAKRKERLLALKANRKGDAKTEAQELPSSQVLFRNYKPEAEVLSEVALPRLEPANVELLVKDQLDDGKKVTEDISVEIANLAPKKITFDLKRGIEKQLDRLERRVDRSIAELIRQRLKEGRQQDFVMEVNVGAREHQTADSDED